MKEACPNRPPARSSTSCSPASPLRDLAEGNRPATEPPTFGTVLVDGEHAVLLGVLRNVVAATGTPYESRVALHLTVHAGEIVRYHVYEDSLAIALAAGAVVPVS